jgi:hypothetical protein
MRPVLFVAIAISLLGCPLTKKSAPDAAAVADLDAAIDAAPVARPDPAADATNKAKVARYGDETKIDPQDTKLVQGVAARSFPPNGDFIALLRAGTDVTKVSLHEDYVLVAFANPKNGSEKLIGWISPSGFRELAAGAAPKTASCKADKDCKANQRCVLTGPARNIATCALACAATAPVCPTGQECNGEGTLDGTFFAFCTAVRAKSGSDTFKIGDRVQVEWHGGWYPASVIGQPSPSRYRIHYDGYDSSWDENVDPTRIKKK